MTQPTVVLDATIQQLNHSEEKAGEMEQTTGGENLEDKSGGEIGIGAQAAITALVPQKNQEIAASITNLSIGLINDHLLPVLSDMIGATINPIKLIDMNSLALAQIKYQLGQMDKKLDTLLNTEMEVAIEYMDQGIFNLQEQENQTDVKAKAKATKAAIEAFE